MQIVKSNEAIGTHTRGGILYIDYKDRRNIKVVYMPCSGCRRVLYCGGNANTAKRRAKRFLTKGA